ncbi:restriction endonuclease subunit S [Lawsonella sp.]|nr:restriction endonuclease subunit S [Lawsonella sp.]
MPQQALTPAIRFKGFTDAWEQRTTDSLVSKSYGGGTPSTENNDFWQGSLPWIQSSDLVDGLLSKVTYKKYISSAALRCSAAQQIPPKSIAIVTRVGVGKLALVDVSYATSQDFISLSDIRCNELFLCYNLYLSLKKIIGRVQGTAIKGINKEEILNRKLMIPGLTEQGMIGQFFSQIDSLIALHQRKLEKLHQLKSAFLSKMFV